LQISHQYHDIFNPAPAYFVIEGTEDDNDPVENIYDRSDQKSMLPLLTVSRQKELSGIVVIDKYCGNDSTLVIVGDHAGSLLFYHFCKSHIDKYTCDLLCEISNAHNENTHQLVLLNGSDSSSSTFTNLLSCNEDGTIKQWLMPPSLLTAAAHAKQIQCTAEQLLLATYILPTYENKLTGYTDVTVQFTAK